MKSFTLKLLMSTLALTGYCGATQDIANPFNGDVISHEDPEHEAAELLKKVATLSAFIAACSAKAHLQKFVELAQEIKSAPAKALKLKTRFPKIAQAMEVRFGTKVMDALKFATS